jgi:hypothetical protein
MLPRPIGEPAEPEQGIGPPAPELPFFQQWYDRTEPPREEDELRLAGRTFADFVDTARAERGARLSETEPDTYETEMAGRDGRRIMIQVKEDDQGRVSARRVVIPWTDDPGNTAGTYYEAYYSPHNPRPEYVLRDETNPGLARAAIWELDEFTYDPYPDDVPVSNRAVGMREVVGLTEYLRDE